MSFQAHELKEELQIAIISEHGSSDQAQFVSRVQVLLMANTRRDRPAC